MRLNNEPVTISFYFDEPMQSYCVEEVEFHGVSIDREIANVRFPPIPDIGLAQLTALGRRYGHHF